MASLQISFTFPYRWINDPESRKYLSENLCKQIKTGSVNNVFATSASDPYFATKANFAPAYSAVLKYHAWQPVKIKLTQAQLEKALAPKLPGMRLMGFQTFFVQTSNPSGLPVMELELYY